MSIKNLCNLDIALGRRARTPSLATFSSLHEFIQTYRIMTNNDAISVMGIVKNLKKILGSYSEAFTISVLPLGREK